MYTVILSGHIGMDRAVVKKIEHAPFEAQWKVIDRYMGEWKIMKLSFRTHEDSPITFITNFIGPVLIKRYKIEMTGC